MKKLLALFLSLLMVFATLPMVMASAADYYTPEDVSNPDNWVVGQWDMNNGTYASSNTNRAALNKIVAVEPGTIYEIALSGSAANGLSIVLRTYDSSAKFSGSYNMSAIKEYTAPAGVYYISITIYDKANVIDLVKAGSVVATMTVKGTKEYTASFAGTETAVLAESVDAITSTIATSYAITLPEATLAEGEFAGWATEDAPTTVIAAGTEVVVDADTTFYAVLTDKPAAATPAAPTVAKATSTSVTLTKVTDAVYSMDGATWQSSNEFKSLTMGETYTFYQKLKETLTYGESASSEALVYATPISYTFDWVRGKDGVNDFNETITPAGSALTTKDYSDGTCMYVSRDLVVGDVLSYTTKKDVAFGIYRVDFEVRASSGRANLGIKIGDRDYGTFVTGSGGSNTIYTLFTDYVQTETAPVTITLTAKTAGKMYIEQLHFTKVGEFNPTEAKIKIDGEVVEIIEPHTTYTIPTPAAGYCYSDGTNTYYGGEVVEVAYGLDLTTEVKTTKVVYTMDEGSTLEAGIFHFGAAEVVEVKGDKKLAVKAKSDASTYLKLAADWAKIPYYKATKITFTASTNSTTNVKAFKNMYFSENINSTCGASGASYKLFDTNAMKYFNTTISLNVTEEMYGYRYFSGQLYCGNHTDSNPMYVYYDNVTIEYTYDFDYVEEEPEEPVATYDITIDGEVVATVEEGATFVLPALEDGKYYVGGYAAGQEFVVTEALSFETAVYTYEITVDGEVVATVPFGTEYTLPELEAGKYYVDADETTFVVISNLAFTTATYTYDVTIDGVAVGTYAYGTTFTLPATVPGSYYADGYVAGQEFVITGPLAFTTAIHTFDITVDGKVVATVEYGTEYTLPALAAGKYYVDVEETTFVVTEALTFTTATYTFDITIDGVLTATVEYGKTFVLPAAPEGYEYVDGYKAGQKFTVTEALAFTTKILEYLDGEYTIDDVANPENWVEGQYKTDGTFNPASTARASVKKLIAVEAGTTYVLDAQGASLKYVVRQYDADKKIISSTPSMSFGAKYTPAEGVAYIGLVMHDGSPLADIQAGVITPSMRVYVEYSITVDGEVVATVEQGTEYTLPELEAGKYYVGNPETTFVVTEDVAFTTATYTYDITIDGVLTATVAYGETFVLPATIEGKQYVGGYVAGQEFVVTEALAFTTEDIPAPVVSAATIAGAGVRFNEVTGMRFKATIDTAAVEEAKALGYEVTMGTLIAPADRFDSYEALTFDADANNYLDVVTEGYYNEENGTIAGSISNVKEANWGRDFFARAYVKLVKDGKTVVYYADAANARSIKTVAQAALEDSTMSYNSAQIDLLNKWAAAK